MTAKPPRLYIVGLGIPEKDAATAQALEALKRCRTIFAASPKDPFFQELCADVRPYGRPSFDAKADLRRESVAPILDAAAKAGPVAFAIYGHPMLYEPIAALLLREARKQGLRVEVVAGVSSIGVVLAALGQPLLPDEGLQVGDVNFFTEHGAAPHSALLIYKAGMVPDRDRAKLLKTLLASRPAHTQVALVALPNWPSEPHLLEWHRLDRVAARFKKPISMYATLFVPAAPR